MLSDKFYGLLPGNVLDSYFYHQQSVESPGNLLVGHIGRYAAVGIACSQPPQSRHLLCIILNDAGLPESDDAAEISGKLLRLDVILIYDTKRDLRITSDRINLMSLQRRMEKYLAIGIYITDGDSIRIATVSTYSPPAVASLRIFTASSSGNS